MWQGLKVFSDIWGSMEKMAKSKKKNRKKLIRKLRNRYRLVVMNDVTFNESFSAYLTPWNVIAGVVLLLIIMSGVVVSLVVFTPLKEYIPGYSDTETRKRAMSAAMRVDSLEHAQEIYSQYFKNVHDILTGNVNEDTSGLSHGESTRQYENLDFSASRADSMLRREIEARERFALRENAGAGSDVHGFPGIFFFTPVRGTVISGFNTGSGHYGIDVAAAEGETVKAVFDGTVVMATFTSDGGNVIQIQHPNNLISIYKHNSVLLRKVGDRVKAGESIAIIGNSGELTDGPHLHFELWYNGTPLDPLEYIAFST